MKFIVSSSNLLNRLQAISKVVSTRSSMPILEHFLFEVEGQRLKLTASDLETTIVTYLDLSYVEGEGSVAIPAQDLLEYIKTYSDVPLTIELVQSNEDADSLLVKVSSEQGEQSLPGANSEEYPDLPTVAEDAAELKLPADVLLQGIMKTAFATASDEALRAAVLSGILFDMKENAITFVASDSQVLVRYKRTDVVIGKEGKFVLPKSPVNTLKGVLKDCEEEVVISFDSNNAVFTMPNYTLYCRLVDGTFPDYNTVIPTGNENKLTVDRETFLTAIKRSSIAAKMNQANLLTFDIKENKVLVEASDYTASVVGKHTAECQYEGEPMKIGFKAKHMTDLLSNLNSQDILMQIGDAKGAALISPVQVDIEEEDTLMLIMPISMNEYSY